MAKEIDATWKNIKIQMKQLKVLIDEAENQIDNAIDNMHAAGNLWKEIDDFLEIRKEYENNGELMTYIDSMDSSIDNLCKQIAEIKKGR